MSISDIVKVAYSGSVIYRAGGNSSFTLNTSHRLLKSDIEFEVGNATDTTDATLSSSMQMLSAVTAYANDVKYTGAIGTYLGATNTGAAIPYYTGTYSVTPAGVQQTFATAGKYLSQDVVIGAYSSIGPSDQYFRILERIDSGSIVYGGSTVRPYLAFQCDTLTGFQGDNVTEIGTSAFDGCRSLFSVSFPSCRTIAAYAFHACFISSISFPACTNVSNYAFEYCMSLESASLPACTALGYYAFNGCYKLSSISLPVCVHVSNYAFASCYALSTIALPSCASIGAYVFSRCYSLVSLNLLGSSICVLSNSNAFYSTPIAGYTASTGGVYGSIYVPASLLASYQAATNWSYFSSRFVGV